MRTCEHCHSSYPERMRFCPVDGAALSAIDPYLYAIIDDQFRLDGVLGRGATGSVYRALQLGMEREVAVKLLHPQCLSREDLVTRFLREARASARLSHPNIITMYAVGTTEAGAPYLAMELALGPTLEEELRRGPLGVSRALGIFRQITSAVSEAHQAGIVHRDLKPGNIILSRHHSSRDVVKVLDFGIAKILDENLRQGETELTRQGAVFGTPQYLSPEQAQGVRVDHRADLYSLGVLLYEMLSGTRPFSGSGFAVMLAHMHEPPAPLRRHAASVSPELERIVMRLLEKRPDDRFQSCDELLAALDRACTRQPRRSWTSAPTHPSAVTDTSLPAPGSGSRVLRWFALPLAVAALLAAGIALTGGLGGRAASAERAPERANEVSRAAEGAMAPLPVARRAVMLSAGGYALRALIPTRVAVGQPQSVLFDAWQPDGQPLEAEELVVLLSDPDGDELGLVARRGELPGRFVLNHDFERSGDFILRVVPSESAISVRLHIEVSEAGDAPQS